jgi:hypothetical protein
MVRQLMNPTVDRFEKHALSDNFSSDVRGSKQLPSREGTPRSVDFVSAKDCRVIWIDKDRPGAIRCGHVVMKLVTHGILKGCRNRPPFCFYDGDWLPLPQEHKIWLNHDLAPSSALYPNCSPTRGSTLGTIRRTVPGAPSPRTPDRTENDNSASLPNGSETQGTAVSACQSIDSRRLSEKRVVLSKALPPPPTPGQPSRLCPQREPGSPASAAGVKGPGLT